MSGILIVAIIFGSIVTLVGLICITILVLVRMRHSGVGGAASTSSRDEAKMIQEIFRGLERMEERIEALETILMDRHDNKGDSK
jgi:phage shock protein B